MQELPQVQELPQMQELPQVQELAQVEELVQIQELAQIQILAQVEELPQVQELAQVEELVQVQELAQIQVLAQVQEMTRVVGLARGASFSNSIGNTQTNWNIDSSHKVTIPCAVCVFEYYVIPKFDCYFRYIFYLHTQLSVAILEYFFCLLVHSLLLDICNRSESLYGC